MKETEWEETSEDWFRSFDFLLKITITSLALLNWTRIVGLGRALLLLNLTKWMQSRTWTNGKGSIYITAWVEELHGGRYFLACHRYLVLSGNSVMAKNARLNFLLCEEWDFAWDWGWLGFEEEWRTWSALGACRQPLYWARTWLLLNLPKRMQSRTRTKGKGLVYITAWVEEIAWWSLFLRLS